MTPRYRRVLVSGSVGFDHIMVMPGRFSDFIMPDKIHRLNVSFTVDSLRKEFGGTGGNCAYTLGLLGHHPVLLAAWGEDAREYEKHLKQVGVKTAHVLLDKAQLSASGHVMTDLDDNQIWSYYPGAMAKSRKIKLKEIYEDGDLVALLPSNPVTFSLQLQEAVEQAMPFLFDPAFFIANLDPDLLRLGVSHAQVIIGNDYEVALLEKRTGTTQAHWGTEQTVVVTTMGGEGSLVRQGRQEWQIPVAKVKSLEDPTGAGDAYRAGFLDGFIRGLALEECGMRGAVSAAYTVEKFGTQTHTFAPKSFEARFRSNFA